MGVLIGIAWMLSDARGAVNWRRVAIALALQVAIALLLLKIPAAREGFLALNGVVDALTRATRAGTGFVFGYLGGGDVPFEISNPAAIFILGLQALPLMLVMSALSALGWHWRILPVVVRGFAWVLQRLLRVGGAVGVSAAANIFVGMVEAPLVVRPYLSRLTRSELFVMMTCGMATVAGTMMVLYASVLETTVPGALGHILTASVISLPAAILIAQVMVPETGRPTQATDFVPPRYGSAMDAITSGTQQGLVLLANVVAMLVVLVALVALLNLTLALLPEAGGAPLTLQRILGWIFAPLVWLIGIPWAEAQVAGALMGTKTVLNEFIAYLDLVGPAGEALSARSRLILLYAMCGFANFGSLGIMIGGLSAMVPERRAEIARMGFKSIVAGTLATMMTGAIVGLI